MIAEQRIYGNTRKFLPQIAGDIAHQSQNFRLVGIRVRNVWSNVTTQGNNTVTVQDITRDNLMYKTTS